MKQRAGRPLVIENRLRRSTLLKQTVVLGATKLLLNPSDSISQDYSSPAVLIFLLVRVALNAQLNQAVNQVGIVKS
jgi:hypothetical protein